MPELLLLRHAKSSWDDPGLSDAERPLAPRGRKAAKRLARYLEREGLRPELVLCSPARRTRETLEAILPALGSPEVGLEDGLYGADAGDLLARLRRIPARVRCAMLVGHNPALQDLVLDLCPGGGERRRVEEKLPTGALAVLEVPAWDALGPGRAALTRLVLPRELDG